jgi:hypothetical protein
MICWGDAVAYLFEPLCNKPEGHRLVKIKSKSKAIPHCLDYRLTVNCEILATCSSTYSPVRTSQEAHSVSIK